MTKKKESVEVLPTVVKETPKPKVCEPTEMDPGTMIMTAIDKGASIEVMERMFALQERWEAKQAKKAFDNAIAAFQGECPTIQKKKKGGETQNGKTAYMYAPLELIVETVKDLLAKHGLSYAIKIDVSDGKVKATCIAKHLLGHSEESVMEVPLVNKTGVMSNAQVTAATATFAKRYAFVNVFGIMTGDADIDSMPRGGQAATVADPGENEKLIARIMELSTKGKEPIAKYLKHFNVEGLEQLDNLRLKMIEKTIGDKINTNQPEAQK